jgi:hypothetical protein
MNESFDSAIAYIAANPKEALIVIIILFVIVIFK